MAYITESIPNETQIPCRALVACLLQRLPGKATRPGVAAMPFLAGPYAWLIRGPEQVHPLSGFAFLGTCHFYSGAPIEGP